MRKVILLMGMGLDGVSARGWSPPIADEAAASEVHEDMWEEVKSIDTFIFGRVNYDLWKKVWPPLATSPSSSEFEKRFSRLTDSARKLVFSTTLKSVDWPHLSPPAPAGPISAGIAGARVRPSAVLLTASGGPVRRKVRAP